MDHQRQSDPVGQLTRALDRQQADTSCGVAVDSRLDPEDQIAILVDDQLGEIDIQVIGVRQFPGRRDQTNRRQVQQRERANPARLDDESAEAGERIRSRTADIQPGRHPADRGDRVRLDTPVGDAPVDMCVQIDEARRHDLPTRVDDTRRVRRVDPGSDCRDLPAADRDIQLPVNFRGRVDHSPAADHGVVLTCLHLSLPSLPAASPRRSDNLLARPESVNGSRGISPCRLPCATENEGRRERKEQQ